MGTTVYRRKSELLDGEFEHGEFFWDPIFFGSTRQYFYIYQSFDLLPHSHELIQKSTTMRIEVKL